LYELIDLGLTIGGEPLADNPWDSGTYPLMCTVFSGSCYFDGFYGWVYQGSFTVVYKEFDFSHFHPEARALATLDNQVAAGTQPMRAIIDIFENVFGPISCAGVDEELFAYIDPSVPNEHYNDGHCAFLTIARYHNAMRGEGVKGTGPLFQIESQVQLRSRWVIGSWTGKRHLSVHLQSQGQFTTNREWLGAFPTASAAVVASGPGGNLVSCDRAAGPAPCAEKYFTDSAAQTELTALVAPIPPLGAVGLWQQAKLSDGKYNDDLTYCARPEEGKGAVSGNCTGFNSNGYAIGLINATGASINQNSSLFEGTDNQYFDLNDINVFPGVATPVPISEF
jgi:hypothetical protein